MSPMAEFAKRVRSILWRDDPGKVKGTYNAWQSKVEFLQSQGHTKQQAVLMASKEYPLLHRLWREYDLREYDPSPESHPALYASAVAKDIKQAGGVVCEGKQQSYRDSLNWAIEAAGKYIRTGQSPVSCPCDAAYYLYDQAVKEPKDFLGRLGQVESKGVGNEPDSDIRRAGRRSLREIEEFLKGLTNDSEAID